MPTLATGTAKAASRGPSLTGVAIEAASTSVRRALRRNPRPSKPVSLRRSRPATAASGTFLLFVGAGGEVTQWSMLDERPVTLRRGPDFPPELLTAARVIAVVPGEQVAVLRVPLPAGLTDAQAIAAARLIVAEVASEPVSELHIALGGADPDGTRLAAFVATATMRGWLEALARQGAVPDAVVPAPLVLGAPDGDLACYALGGSVLVRGRDEAFALEPHLAAIVTAERQTSLVPEARFVADLRDQIQDPALDLLQGPFRGRGRWSLPAPSIRKLVLLAAVVVAIGLAGEVASAVRYSVAASTVEEKAEKRAAEVLPRGTVVSDPPAQLRQHLSSLPDGPGGFGPLAAALFAAVRDSGGVELAELRYERGAGLTAIVRGSSAVQIDGLQARLKATGYSIAEEPATREGGLLRRSIRIFPE